MPSTDREELPRRRSDGELLEQVYAKGGKYRRRRRRLLTAGVVAGMMATVSGSALVVRLPGGPPQDVAARGVAAPAGPGLSTSTTVRPLELPPEVGVSILAQSTVPTTAAAAAARPSNSASAAPVTTAAPDSSSPEPSPPPTAESGGPGAPVKSNAAGASGASALAATGENEPPACLNSTDPACGPFRWEPEPEPNAPLAVTVTATPRPDDSRTFDFAIVYSDPDAHIREDCRMSDFGDGGTVAASGCAVAACLATYGPWTPPAKEAGHAEARTSHTFAAPGTYTVRFSASSGGVCGHPYASTGTGSTEVVVPA